MVVLGSDQMNKNHKMHKQIMKLCKHFNKPAYILWVEDDDKIKWIKYDKTKKDDGILTYINNVPILTMMEMFRFNPTARIFKGQDNMFIAKGKKGKIYALIDIEGSTACVHKIGDYIYDKDFETFEGHESYSYAKKNYEIYKETHPDIIEDMISIDAFIPIMLHGTRRIQTEEDVVESFNNIKNTFTSLFKY